MYFIGDVHGKYKQYKRLITEHHPTIQVGDMGVGFFNARNGAPSQNPPHYAMLLGNHRFIRGNHDNPGVCKTHSQYIEDGTVENDVMYIGGALSVDRAYRHQGFDYWEDEELSVRELNALIDVYIQKKPRVMVTHDCPESVAEALCQHLNLSKFNDPSRTRQSFDSMFSAHSPKIWIFGHWHVSLDIELRGTRFICLNELEVKDVNIEGSN